MYNHSSYITGEYDNCYPMVLYLLQTTSILHPRELNNTYGYIGIQEIGPDGSLYTYICILFKNEREAMLAKIQCPALQTPSEGLIQYLTEVGII